MPHAARAAAVLLALSGVAAPAALAAPPGYTRVFTPAITVHSGPFDAGGDAACPAGTVAWGGGIGFTGGIADIGDNINTSEPSGDGWEGRYNNTTGRDQTFAVEAICAARPPGYTVAFRTIDNSHFAQSTGTAVCPTGTVVLSGGGLSTSDEAGASMLAAWPSSQTRFKAIMYNGTPTDQRFTIFAICAQRPAGYAIVSAKGHDSGGPGTALGGSQCPTGVVIGGGVKFLAPQPAVTLGALFGEPEMQYLAEVENDSPAPIQETLYAICAA
jgi:hypothetical protein